MSRPECGWLQRGLEQQALDYAIEHVVPEHLSEVRNRKIKLLDKTEAAVKERLTKEITYWDHRSEELKLQEQAAKSHSRLNSARRESAPTNSKGDLHADSMRSSESGRFRRCHRTFLAACSSSPRACSQKMRGVSQMADEEPP